MATSITPRAVKDPATALSNWKSGVAASGQKWANGYANPRRDPFQAAAQSVSVWQAAVASPAAATAYVSGLNSVDETAVMQTVNGPGMSKYTQSPNAKSAKATAFFNTFLPKLGNIVSNLDRTNPRGPRGSAQNITRLTSYLQSVAQTRGSN